MVLSYGSQFWLNHIWKLKKDKISLPFWESDSVGMRWAQESEFSTITFHSDSDAQELLNVENTDLSNTVNFEQKALKTHLKVTVSDLKKKQMLM